MVAVHVLPPLSVLFKEALQREYQPGYVKEEDVDSDAAAPTPGQVTPIEQPPDASNRACVKQRSGWDAPGSEPSESRMNYSKDVTDVTLFPRRKAGQKDAEGGRGPVVLTVELLETFYGVPLHVAAKELVSNCVMSCLMLEESQRRFVFSWLQGICQTAIKKSCRSGAK